MSWTPDPILHEPQPHPEYPDVRYVTFKWKGLNVPEGVNLYLRCPFVGADCEQVNCVGGYFITTANLVAIRLTGKL